MCTHAPRHTTAHPVAVFPAALCVPDLCSIFGSCLLFFISFSFSTLLLLRDFDVSVATKGKITLSLTSVARTAFRVRSLLLHMTYIYNTDRIYLSTRAFEREGGLGQREKEKKRKGRRRKRQY